MERERVIWTPNRADAQRSQLGQFLIASGFASDEYDALHRWSISDPVAFWRKAWEFIGLLGDRGSKGIVDHPDMGHRHFFPEGTINVAENMLRHDPETTALLQMDAEGNVARRITFGELREDVTRIAGWMAEKGVKAGDVVATICTNRSEVVVSMLAAAAIGAIWTAASPDLTAQAIIDRIGQVNPSVLFVLPEYTYNNKRFNFSETLQTIEEKISSIREIVIIGDPESGNRIKPVHAKATPYDVARGARPISRFERHPFNSPFLILYTSGTTGKPKAIVHSGGGVLLRCAVEHRFHTGVASGDVFFQYSNIAWMMFPWTVMALETGTALVLYEDAAVKKTEAGIDPSPVWRIAAESNATTLGLSPNLLRIVQRSGYSPSKEHDLTNLRTMLCSGAPMSSDLYGWSWQNIALDLRINSVSGGTEAMGSLVYGSPLHIVRPGEMPCKTLGIATDVFDDRGASIAGQPGELVVTQPFPSMPLTFWGEDGDRRYKAAYFESFPNVWTHGDLAEQTVRGGFIIHGRSDNTLKPGGVRLGTAEIYTAIEDIPVLEDAVIFGRPMNDDEEIVMCAQLKNGTILTEALAAEIRTTIRSQTSPRHVPGRIFQVSEIPKTLNGKRVEAAAKAAALGKDTSRFASLANRECLDEYGTVVQTNGF